MSDQTGRVVPSSRLPVTPDDPASPTAAPQAVDPETSPAAAAGAARANDVSPEGHDRIGGTSALNPTSSSAASAGLTDDVRPANFADAEEESVRTGGTPDFGGGTASADTYPRAATAEDTYPGSSTYPGVTGPGGSAGTPSSGTGLSAAPSVRDESDLMATAQPGAESSDVSTAYGGVTGSGTTARATGGATSVSAAAASGGPSASERAKDLVARGRTTVTRLAQDDRVAVARTKVQTAAAGSPLAQQALAKVADLRASRQQAGKRRAPAQLEEPRPAPPPLPAPPSGPRSQDQIESDIEARRTHLAWAVDEINYRVKPANLVAKGKTQAQAQVVDPASGSVRTERVGPAVGVVVGLFLLRVIRARRRRKKARARWQPR